MAISVRPTMDHLVRIRSKIFEFQGIDAQGKRNPGEGKSGRPEREMLSIILIVPSKLRGFNSLAQHEEHFKVQVSSPHQPRRRIPPPKSSPCGPDHEFVRQYRPHSR